jgi:hypothetical protein
VDGAFGASGSAERCHAVGAYDDGQDVSGDDGQGAAGDRTEPPNLLLNIMSPPLPPVAVMAVMEVTPVGTVKELVPGVVMVTVHCPTAWRAPSILGIGHRGVRSQARGSHVVVFLP